MPTKAKTKATARLDALAPAVRELVLNAGTTPEVAPKPAPAKATAPKGWTVLEAGEKRLVRVDTTRIKETWLPSAGSLCKKGTCSMCDDARTLNAKVPAVVEVEMQDGTKLSGFEVAIQGPSALVQRRKAIPGVGCGGPNATSSVALETTAEIWVRTSGGQFE